MQRRYFLHDGLIPMEYALLIENEKEYLGKQLSAYHLSWGSGINELAGADCYLKRIGDKRLSYLYYGNEFCEYLLPEPKQLHAIRELCDKEELTLVFVTPVVTDYGIKKLERLLNYIDSRNLLSDIVVNDVGVLMLIHQRYPDLNCIAGRVFDKTSHDSRVTYSEIVEYYGDKGIQYAKTPSVLSGQSLAVFQKFGVSRFEFDLPKIGLNIPENIDCSLYWPYSYLTTGRVCFFRTIDQTRQKHLVGSHGCKQLCRKYWIEKRKPINGLVTDRGWRVKELFLFQRGNTVFYVNNMDNKTLFSSQLEQFDRLIVQP